MPLSQQQKDAIDNYSNIEKAELIIYALLGREDADINLGLGRAMVATYYPQFDPLEIAPNYLALAILRENYRFNKEVYVAWLAEREAEAARLAAIDVAEGAISPTNPIDPMPEPEVP